MTERVISLVDLILDILSHWRGLLVCMLVGALLMGGFSYLRSRAQESSKVKVTTEEQIQTLEAILNDSEKIAVHTVLGDEQEYAIYQQYTENSILMQMNPQSIPRIDMLFGIQANDNAQSYALKSIYEELVNSVGMFQWVEEQTGISSASVSELITTQDKPYVLSLNDKIYDSTRAAVADSNCLKVMVIHYDETECEKLAKSVKDYIERQCDLLASKFESHEIILLSESKGTMIDTWVRDIQLSCFNTEITLLTNCAKAKDAFTENQQIYYELLKNESDNSEEVGEFELSEESTAVTKFSINTKYVVLGMVLFALIYAGVFFMLYVFNQKLRVSDELQVIYNISQLGLIVKAEGKKKFFVDRWIDAMRNWNRRCFTRKQSLDLAAAAIKISAGKQKMDTVCLLGCDLKAGADVVCQELKERLEQEHITVKILDNVLYNAEAMEELESVKGIILVEKAMSTMYNEILREIELASRQNIDILGGIVVE